MGAAQQQTQKVFAFLSEDDHWSPFTTVSGEALINDGWRLRSELDNVPLCETQMEKCQVSPPRIIHCWKFSEDIQPWKIFTPWEKKLTPKNIHSKKIFTSEKYSLLKNIPSWTIFTPEKYLIPKIFPLKKYSPLYNIHPEKYSPLKKYLAPEKRFNPKIYTPNKYSPLKNIHPWKIFTPEKYSPPEKIFTHENIHP